MEYEGDLRAKGISEPHHLLRLTPVVIETLIPDKPIHQRKLAALSRGRNLNASTFTMELKPSKSAPGGAAPFRSKSADDVLPEKPGLRTISDKSVRYKTPPKTTVALATSSLALFLDIVQLSSARPFMSVRHVASVRIIERICNQQFIDDFFFS